jgi:SAM-dependent methyltransferase
MTSMLGNLGVYLRAAREMPLSEFVARAATRIPGLDGPWLRRKIALADAKGTDVSRMSGFLDRLEALALEHTGIGLGIPGARVLEVGCGPLAGFAPMLFQRGAVSITAIEPDWNGALFQHRDVDDVYLERVAAHLGAPTTAASLRQRLDRDLTVLKSGLENAPTEGPFDLSLSQSCLEHVRDLEASALTLKRVLAPGARQAHLVNFGNHRKRDHPFETIYEMPPEAYHARFGRHINLGRPPDVARAFAAAGLEVLVIPVDRNEASLAKVALHPWWAERYTREDLAIRTAIVLSRA